MTATPNALLYFPLQDGLTLCAEHRRDGAPVEWKGRVPIYGRYWLCDEFETPVLDPSMASFLTPAEVDLVAKAYRRLVAAGHPAPDRMFSEVYVRYHKLMGELPGLLADVLTAPKVQTGRERAALLLPKLAELLA